MTPASLQPSQYPILPSPLPSTSPYPWSCNTNYTPLGLSPNHSYFPALSSFSSEGAYSTMYQDPANSQPSHPFCSSFSSEWAYKTNFGLPEDLNPSHPLWSSLFSSPNSELTNNYISPENLHPSADQSPLPPSSSFAPWVPDTNYYNPPVDVHPDHSFSALSSSAPMAAFDTNCHNPPTGVHPDHSFSPSSATMVACYTNYYNPPMDVHPVHYVSPPLEINSNCCNPPMDVHPVHSVSPSLPSPLEINRNCYNPPTGVHPVHSVSPSLPSSLEINSNCYNPPTGVHPVHSVSPSLPSPLEINSNCNKPPKKVESSERGPGYVFLPTPHDILTHFLPLRHLEGLKAVQSKAQEVQEIDLYGDNSRPPKELFIGPDETHYYFFTTLRKHKGSNIRFSRVSGGGTWDGQKPTDIYSDDRTKIGTKRMFNFKYSDNHSSKEDKHVNWIMQEYSMEKSDLHENIVFCEVYKKLERGNGRK